MRIFLPVVSAVVLTASERPALAVEYAGRLFRDPFADGDAKTVSARPASQDERLSLQGVIWSSGRPQAIVNGKIVKIGDTIQDAEVLDIRKDGVKMRDKDREFSLRFKKGAVT